MKKITENTILIQNDKKFTPVKVGEVIFWVDFSKNISPQALLTHVWSARFGKPIVFGIQENSYLEECFEIVAQSQPKLENIPVVKIQDKELQLQFALLQEIISDLVEVVNQDVIEKLLKCADISSYARLMNSALYTEDDVKKVITFAQQYYDGWMMSEEVILNEINSIPEIKVDKNFQIIH